MLQSFVRDLSEQNEVLIQALEAEEAEDRVVEGRTVSLHKEQERRLSLALCPMPVDLVGTTATFFRTPGEMADRYKDVQTHLPTQDAILQHLKEACLSQQAQVKVEEREAQVQELQDTITELHQEMTRKDQDTLTQLQDTITELHQEMTRKDQDTLTQLQDTITELHQEMTRKDQDTLTQLQVTITELHQEKDQDTLTQLQDTITELHQEMTRKDQDTLTQLQDTITELHQEMTRKYQDTLTQLQDTITELHQEMTRKYQDTLTQLQELHQMESRVKQLTDQVELGNYYHPDRSSSGLASSIGKHLPTSNQDQIEQVRSSEETIGQLRQEVAVRVGISSATLSGDVSTAGKGSTTDSTGSSPVPHLTEQRGRELLKTELSRWDATIQRLRRDVLLSHQARDSQSAQLDVHGQRISQLQRELQESQLELQRGHSRREQQQRDLQTQTQQAEELHTQLAEVKGRLVQVEGENVALMGYKLELRAEVERLAAVVYSLQSSVRIRGHRECPGLAEVCGPGGGADRDPCPAHGVPGQATGSQEEG
ncbi:putative uncharacterized protein DDB_G0271606 isoform X2 [Salmo salar]|uniref:Coiled-coil domain-containing protein 158-like n=1 Tax=Salmo salar TaxID=8030 RepID=A0ABM3E1Q5_SALSA|nr:putative uncharacterized protein DDB_G0271606 isoform X2 [Salmo salar]